jgi:DNA-binding transcriptional MerR regulator
MELLTIGQVARQLGVSVDWLRRAEKDKKIPRARRRLGGWRVYSAADLERLQTLLLPAEGSGW